MQNYRQASRPPGSSGIDTRKSGTEFTQLLWLQQKCVLLQIHKTKTQNYEVKCHTY